MQSPPTHPAYTLLDEAELPIWNAVGWTYRHQSGARVLSIVTPDDNKTFGITFPTHPTDHTGLPHILEHCVLCGSERFPVKEPFKEMLKTSLQTFLNAFTYPDRTCYPVASRNLRDFHNLMDVYLDAVFFPRLTPAVLGQEGWRPQWKEDGSLEIQGVVYNEMKGVYASPDARLDEQVQRALFPDTIYRFDSGGDPAHIPELTFAAFQEFHRRYYQPANAWVGFYGDDDPLERLKKLDEVLSRVPSTRPGVPPPAAQPAWDRLRREEAAYPADPGSDEGVFCQINWLLPDEVTDADARQMTGLTSHLLLNTPASPLRLALLESGLGDDLLGGAQQYLHQPAFGVGLRGVQPGNEEKVFALIDATLEQIAKDGFRPDLLEGGLHQAEFNILEMNSSAKGLHAILTAITPWMYGGDPLDALKPEIRLETVRTEWERNPNLFSNWIREHLLENPARVEVVLRPDPGLGQQEAKEESERFAKLQAELGNDPDARQQTEHLIQEVERFQQTPDRPEDIDTLPRLRIGDMMPLSPQPPMELDRVHGVEVSHSRVESNGILYARLAFDIRHLPLEDLCLLPLYSRCLTELGTGRLDHLAFSEQLSCHSGGVSIDFETSETYRSGEDLAVMLLRTKAMVKEEDIWLELLGDMLASPRLGPAERIHHLLLEERAGEESHMVHAGNQVVSQRLKAMISSMERASEEMDGSTYLLALRKLEAMDPAHLQARIQDLHTRLVHRAGLRAHLGGTPDAVDAARPGFHRLLEQLPAGEPRSPLNWGLLETTTPQGLLIPSPVQFVGMATRLPLEGPATHYSHFVARRLLNTDYLWERVRMQGGAYGCSSSFSHLDGRLVFSSYRDPNLDHTLDAYRSSGEWLRKLSLGSEALEQAKIGTLGKLDPPEKPASLVAKTFFRHLIGLSDEQRLTFWEQILETEETHIQAFGEQMHTAMDSWNRICVLGGAAGIHASRETFDTLHLMGDTSGS